MERVRSTLASGLVGVTDAPDAVERVDQALVGYHRLFLDEPDIRDIWAATQSDKHLQQLDIDDSRANGALLADALRHLVDPADPARHADPVHPAEHVDPARHAEFDAMCLLFAHLAGATARLALAVGEPAGEQLMAELRRNVRRRFQEMLGG